MKWLSGLISKVGENPLFIAFMAHSMFAYFVVSLFPGIHQLIAGAVCLVVFGIKEFWFDMRYEENPPQTFIDSAEDFSGYFIGIILSVLVTHFHL